MTFWTPTLCRYGNKEIGHQTSIVYQKRECDLMNFSVRHLHLFVPCSRFFIIPTQHGVQDWIVGGNVE